MSQENETVVTALGAVDNKANGGQTSEQVRFAIALKGLTSKQLDRYYTIQHRYGMKSLIALDHLKSRRGDLWPGFIKNMDLVNNAVDPMKGYYNTLSEQFSIEEFYIRHDIVTKVSEARSMHKLETFSSNISEKSMEEFKTLFLFEEHHLLVEEGSKERYKAFKPVFAILAS